MLDWLPEPLLKAKETAADKVPVADKETAADKEPVAGKGTRKVTHVEHSTSNAGNLTCQVQVKWIKGEELEIFSMGWSMYSKAYCVCVHSVILLFSLGTRLPTQRGWGV